MSVTLRPEKWGRTWRSSTPKYPRRVVARSRTVVAHQRYAQASNCWRRAWGSIHSPRRISEEASSRKSWASCLRSNVCDLERATSPGFPPGSVPDSVSCSCPVRPAAEPLNTVNRGNAPESLVEVAGIEPASSGISMGLLRAQPAGDCRGHRCYRHLWRPVSDVGVPDGRSEQPVR